MNTAWEVGDVGEGNQGVAAAASEISDHDFRVLFTTHPTPMWVYDPQTLRFLVVNAAATALYGYSAEDYRRMSVLDIRPPSERQRMIEAVKTRSDIERPERWQHLKADGEIIEVLTYGREVRFNGVVAILAIVQDRSEVTKAHREASDVRTLLDSIVRNLPIGVFVKDMADDGRYVLYNEACGEIFSLDPAAVIGMLDHEVFPQTLAETFRRRDYIAMAGEGTFAVEDMLRRPDGTQRNARIVKRAIPTADGSAPRYLLGLAEDVTERRSFETRIAHLAMHDTLTGLPNRAFFTEAVHALATKASRESPVALLYLDIDHFKTINDSMGHPAGDALLRGIAARLRSLVLPGDMVARLGGDEFAIALPLSEGGRHDTRLQTFIRDLVAAFVAPFELEGVVEHVSCSIGVALAPEDGRDETVLLRNADLALYAAKEAGRATYRFYAPGMRLKAQKRHVLTMELRQSLSDGAFELHYQPIMALADDTLVGFEALIRWRHPERGLVLPGEFIEVAEETGLIVGIGEWVIRQACRVAAGWPEHIKIAVNLSPCQFRQVGLLVTVVSALAESRLRPDRLELEITESVFLSDSGHNIEVLNALRALGVRIAMDDFGTGYSSLSYLRSFTFDKIKMDRSFVAGLDAEPGNLAIIKAVVGLGLGFNATTTAEGVETAEQLQRLRAEGLDEAQGHLLGRPMPASDAARLIAGSGRGETGLLRRAG